MYVVPTGMQAASPQKKKKNESKQRVVNGMLQARCDHLMVGTFDLNDMEK